MRGRLLREAGFGLCALALVATLAPPATAQEDGGSAVGTEHDPPTAIEIVGGFDDDPSNFVDLGSRVLFEVGLDQLWVSDGTAEGTHEIDLPDGHRPSLTGGRTAAVDGQAYFPVEDRRESPYQDHLWVTDGTPAGTSRVVDGSQLDLDSIDSLAAYGDRVAFWAKHGPSGDEYRPFVVASPAGASMLVDRKMGGTNPNGAPLRVLDDELYVSTQGENAEGDWDVRLHRIDPDGNEQVVWDAVGYFDTEPATDMTVADSQLFFLAKSDSDEKESLYVSDGTQAGTAPVIPLDDIGSVHRATFTPVDDRLFFVANSRLWVSDGTQGGTTEVWVEDDGSGDPHLGTNTPSELTPVGDRLAFVGGSVYNGQVWWVTDGTPEGTVPLRLDDDTIPDSKSVAVPIGEQLWLGGSKPLVRTDGTSEGTVAATPDVIVDDLGPGGGSPVMAARELYDDDNALWRIEGQAPVWADGAQLTTTSVGSSYVELSWDEASHGNGVTEYRVLVDDEIVARTDGDTTAVLIDGLEEGETVTFTVAAVAGLDDVAVGPGVEVTVDGNSEPGTAPLQAVAVPGAVELEWPELLDAESYRVRRAEGGDSAVQIAEVSASSTSHLDEGPDAATTYRYEVRGVVDGEEQPHTQEAEVTTTPLSLARATASPEEYARDGHPDVAALGTELRVTAEGDPHRSVDATVSYLDTDGAGTDTFALSETEPGIYQGGFALDEGVQRVVDVDVALCDGAGTCEEAGALRGELIVGAALEIDLSTLGVPDGALDGGRVSVVSDEAGGNTTEIADGAVARVDRLVHGDGYRVRVTDAEGRTLGGVDDLALGAGTVARPDVDVVLRNDLVVRVVDESGSPVESSVEVRDEGALVDSGPRRESGRSTFYGLQVGTYEIHATSHERPPTTQRERTVEVELAHDDDQDVVVELPELPQGGVSGTVRDAEGGGVAAATVTITQELDGERWTVRADTDADGNYTAHLPAGDAEVHVSVGQVTESQTVEVRDDDVVIADFDLDVPEESEFQILVSTQYAGEEPEGPLDLDWRTGVHLNLTVDGQRVSREIQRRRIPDGQTVEVCGDGREAGLGSDCTDVEFPDDGGPGAAELVLSQEASLTGGVVDGDGGAWAGNWVGRLFRADGDSLTHVATQGYWGSDVSIPVPGPGEYELRVLGTSSEQVPPTRVTVMETGRAFDIGTLVMQPPGRFAQTSRISASQADAAPGDLLTLRARYENTSPESVTGAALLLDVPEGAQPVEDGLSVDGQPVGLAGLEQDGDAYVVDLGDIEAGDAGVVRMAVRLSEDAQVGSRLDAGGRIRYVVEGASQEESLGAAVATVSGLSVDAPRTTTTREVALSGRAPSGEIVGVFDDTALIGETSASEGGYWQLSTELVDRGPRHRHTLQARVGDETSPEVVVRYDDSAPVATSMAVSQDSGVRESFDPRDGVAQFPFPYLLSRPVIVEAEFDDPDRVVDPVAYVGDNRARMTRNGEVFEASVHIGTVRGPGPVGIDYDTLPAPFDLHAAADALSDEGVVRNRFPRDLDDLEAGEATELDGSASASELQVANVEDDELIDSSGDDVRDFDIQDEDFDDGVTVEAESRRWGVDFDLGLVAKATDDYERTPADEEFEAETGLPVYDHDLSWSLTSSRFRFVGRAAIPVDALPEDEDPEVVAAQMIGAALASGSLGDVAGDQPSVSPDDEEPMFRLASRQRVIKVTYEVTSTGSDVNDLFNALSGGERYEELTDLLDEVVDKCGGSPTTPEHIAELDRIAMQVAAHQIGSAGLGVLGGAAAAATGGLAGIGAIGLTVAADMALDLVIDKMVEDFEDGLDADPECDEDEDDEDDCEGDNCERRKRNRPEARPRWIWDPAGYVFEAVESNRIPDATVTVFEGDPELAEDPEEIASWEPWDAEWFGQANPQITGEDGRYAWDVPEGWWHTRADADGYESVSSEILRVLPEHFDVHLGLVSRADPHLDEILAFDDDDAVEFTFSRWMRVEHVADRITVEDESGEPVPGTVTPVDPEEHSLGRSDGDTAHLVAPEGEELAETFAFTPDGDWGVDDELTVAIDGLVQAYNLRILGDAVEEVVTVASRPEPDPGPDDEDDQPGTGSGGSTPPADEGEGTGFTDVHPDAVHAPSIRVIAEAGIAAGYRDGTFRPRAAVSRGQMASFLQRTLGLPDGDPTMFPDAGTTHGPAIGAIAAAGIARGFEDGTFRPDESVTRGHMATFLARAAGLGTDAPAAFTDIGGTTHERSIAAVAEASFAVGFQDGTFRPGEPVTRGQMASFLVRLRDHLDAGG